MKKLAYLLTITVSLSAILSVNVQADTLVPGRPLKVKDKAPQKDYAFDLSDVLLMDTSFKDAMALDAK